MTLDAQFMELSCTLEDVGCIRSVFHLSVLQHAFPHWLEGLPHQSARTLTRLAESGD